MRSLVKLLLCALLVLNLQTTVVVALCCALIAAGRRA